MRKGFFRQAVCVILIFSISGCSSDYVLNLRSRPSGAKVQIGPKVTGRTPCKIEIPKKSDLIKDHHIDVKYTLEDGTEVVKSYDLRKYEHPETAALIGSGIFIVPGALLFGLSWSEDTDQYTYSHEDKEDPYWPGIGIGLGLMGLGALTYYVLGGDSKAQPEYDIDETFEDVNNTLINQ